MKIIMNLVRGSFCSYKKFFFAVFFIFVIYFYSSSFYYKDQVNMSKKISLRKILQVAVLAAENGGKEVVGNIEKKIINIKGKTLEGADDKVTTADYNSHCVMTQTIKENFPEILLVSEESKESCDMYNLPIKLDEVLIPVILNDTHVKNSDITVWIDPLDATQEYTENLFKYVTTMVCVAVKGEPVIGIIHNPFLKETYWGWVGKSKSSNLNYFHTKQNEEIIFIVSRSHTGDVKEFINSNFDIKNKKKIIEAGGAGYKVLELIRGNADVYLHTTAIKKWDICAGNAILLSVGGKMTTLQNSIIDYSDTENYINKDGLIATLEKTSYHLMLS